MVLIVSLMRTTVTFSLMRVGGCKKEGPKWLSFGRDSIFQLDSFTKEEGNGINSCWHKIMMFRAMK